jgi:hypothetical protein
MLDSRVSYKLIADNLDVTIERIAARSDVAREVDYYRANIGNVKSIDDFMQDRRLVNFAMTAHGMSDLSYAKGLIRKTLEEGIDENDALANRLSDRRFREFASTFNFKRYEAATTSFDRASEGTVQKFLRQTVETEAGEQNQTVRLSLYFQRNTAEIENAFDVLSDPALLEVVRVAAGLPATISALDIDRQAELINAKLNFDDFSSPEKLNEFIERFTILRDLEQPPTAATSGAVTLLGGPASFGIPESILMSLQNIRQRR